MERVYKLNCTVSQNSTGNPRFKSWRIERIILQDHAVSLGHGNPPYIWWNHARNLGWKSWTQLPVGKGQIDIYIYISIHMIYVYLFDPVCLEHLHLFWLSNFCGFSSFISWKKVSWIAIMYLDLCQAYRRRKLCIYIHIGGIFKFPLWKRIIDGDFTTRVFRDHNWPLIRIFIHQPL